MVVVDNFSTGRRENLTRLLEQHSQSLTVIGQDVTQKLADQSDKLDVVVNMACPASPLAYQRLAIETLRVCSTGTENLLRLALKHKCRFVQASTSEVYGDPLTHPQPESYWGNVNSYGARSMYDEGKRYAEALIWSYRQVFKVNTGIIRIFNTYGPYMSPDDGRVITNFLHQALKGKQLTVYGDGKQTRSFCYVDDQIDAWVKMMEGSIEGPINVGNPNEFSILELVDTIAEVLGKKLDVVFEPKPTDDPTQRRPDITLAKKLLGWEPKISLKEGLEKMIDWIRLEEKLI